LFLVNGSSPVIIWWVGRHRWCLPWRRFDWFHGVLHVLATTMTRLLSTVRTIPLGSLADRRAPGREGDILGALTVGPITADSNNLHRWVLLLLQASVQRNSPSPSTHAACRPIGPPTQFDRTPSEKNLYPSTPRNLVAIRTTHSA
jgi:hypothetical protein